MAVDDEFQGPPQQLVDAMHIAEKARQPSVSPAEHLEINGSRVTRTFLCDWKSVTGSYNRYNAAATFVGWSERRTGGAIGHLIYRYLPDAHWDFKPSTLQPFLFARTCKIEPIGKPQTSLRDAASALPCAQYTQCWLTVEYSTRNYIVCKWNDLKDSDGTSNKREFNRFVTEEYDPVGEALMLPRGTMKFAEAPPGSALLGESFNEGVAKILPRAKVRWTWHEVPWDCVPWAVLDASLGKINESEFKGRFHTFAEGTLLLEDAEAIQNVSALGNPTFDLVYNVLYNPKKHYKVGYKAQEQGVDDFDFFEVTTDGQPAGIEDGHRLYDSFDWETLFLPI